MSRFSRGSATVSWDYTVVAAGSYQVQFAVWDRNSDRILVRAPCPREKLIVAHEPTLPTVTGIEPAQPRSRTDRQWLSIKGEGFAEQSTVVLSILGNTYFIPPERTEFVSPGEVKIFVGLTDPGSWTAQIINPGDLKSNAFEFVALP
jgi:hypothetical protein